MFCYWIQHTFIYEPYRHCLQDGYIHDSYLQDGYIHKQLPKTVNYKTHYTGRFLLVLHLLSPRIPYVISILLLSPRVPACSILNSIYRKRLYSIQIQYRPLIWLKPFKKLTVGEFRGNIYSPNSTWRRSNGMRSCVYSGPSISNLQTSFPKMIIHFL